MSEDIDIEPVGHRVLIELIEDEKAKEDNDKLTKSSIVIPDFIKDRGLKDSVRGSDKGKVIALGPYAYYGQPGPWVEVGDIVYFVRYEGVQNSEEKYSKYRTINDDDIYNRVKPNRRGNK